jgi:ATP-binding cassette subfamily B protein
MSPGKRLFQYALLFKKTILLALLILTAAVSAELSGPFIAKKMIDTHMLGIEFPWHETSQQEEAVFYDDRWYKRSDHFSPGEPKGKEVRVLQVDRAFYFLGQPLRFDGERKVENGILTVTRGSETAAYQVKKVTAAELFAFFRPEIKYLLILSSVYLALLVVSSFLHYGKRYLLQVAANRIIQKMRMDVFAQIQRLPITYFDNLPAGKVVSRVTNDTEAIRELYVTVLAMLFTNTFYMVGIFAALFLLEVRLALICLLLVPILAIWIKLYRKYASSLNHLIRSRLSDINGMINESIQGMPMIRAFRRQTETEKEFESLNEEHFRYQSKLLHLNSITSFNLVNALRHVAFVVLIWYFGSASFGEDSVISLGLLYAFVDYLNRLFQPITGIVNQLPQLEQAIVAAERVFELLDQDGIDVATEKIGRFKGNVVFDRVSFAYKNEDYVLKDISFAAKQGETVALVGHTGSGKSSIINVLFRFYDINKGTITIDGQNLLAIPRQQLRQHMGIVLQDPFLFTGTIASNVSLGDPSISREKVEKALRDVGADQLLHGLPRGFDEPVLEKGSTLSVGQRQLISFARALAFDPAILILDEATSSIDTETESLIQAALDVVKKGRTTFIIAHRLSTIKHADQILVLERGQIAERGTHDELMEKRGKYYQMYQLQQGEVSSLVKR